MKTRLNKPHALNPAIALRFQIEHHWRGVSDADRWAIRSMIAAIVMLNWPSVRASDNDYFYNRKWIELSSATNTTPKEERLFVGRSHSPKYAEIVQFRKGITLRELIDRSPLKGKVVQVCVMWPHTIPKSGSTFTRHEYITVRPTDNPTYQLKNLDVVWFYEEGPIIIR